MYSKLLTRISGAALALLVAVPAVAQVSTVPTQPIIGIPAGATIPRVISTNPTNMSETVNAGLRQITITFDQPMDVAAFFWNIPAVATFPRLTDRPNWSNGNRTMLLSVQLAGNAFYEIPLNVDQQNFRAATGVPLQRAKLQFWTGRGGSGGMSLPSTGATRYTPVPGAPGIPQGAGGANIAPRAGSAGGFQTGSRTGGAAVAPTPAGAVPTPFPSSSRGGGFSLRPAAPTPTP